MVFSFFFFWFSIMHNKKKNRKMHKKKLCITYKSFDVFLITISFASLLLLLMLSVALLTDNDSA